MVKMKQLALIKLLLKSKMPKEVEKKCLTGVKKIKKYESNVSRGNCC